MNQRHRIIAETALVSPRLCPEIELRLITEACPLWRATERELAAVGWAEPYWAFAWPGGQALARFLIDHPERVAGRRVLDFGAGSGIVAIAAARAGARSVLAADVDRVALEAVALNASLNGVCIDTTDIDLTRISDGGAWDLVLAGDIAYDRPQAERFLDWLDVQAKQGRPVLLADPHRGFIDPRGLDLLAEYDAPADVDTNGAATRRTAVYAMPEPLKPRADPRSTGSAAASKAPPPGPPTP